MYIRYSLHVYDTSSYAISVRLVEMIEKWKDRKLWNDRKVRGWKRFSFSFMCV